MSRLLSRFTILAGLLLANIAWGQTVPTSGPSSSTMEPPRALPPGCAYPSYPSTTTPYPSTTPSDRTGVGDQGMGAGQAPTADQTAAQQSEAGTQPSGSYSPVMFGDLLGVQGRRLVLLPPGVSPAPGQAFTAVGGNRIALIAPGPTRSAFKVTENETPRPEDRCYLTYNYYNNVDRVLTGPNVHSPTCTARCSASSAPSSTATPPSASACRSCS